MGYNNTVKNWNTSLKTLRKHVVENRKKGATSRYDIINLGDAKMGILPFKK
jgi:hypothetical protein